jgi:phosphopantetheinyl transferase
VNSEYSQQPQTEHIDTNNNMKLRNLLNNITKVVGGNNSNSTPPQTPELSTQHKGKAQFQKKFK